MKTLISNIQHFSLHDGPGIRTTIFFMGCSLKCPWCCNPENLSATVKEYKDVSGVNKFYGREYSSEELENEILKDKTFYDDDGGVTYSGGEALLYLKNHIDLLQSLKNQKIHQCVETSLNVPTENLEKIIDCIDLFYVDLKIVDAKEFYEKLNGNIELVKNNLKILKKYNAKVIFRVPLVRNYTLKEENLVNMKKIIKDFNPIDVEVFSVHNLGKSKYKNLNLNYNDFEIVSDEIVNKVLVYLKNNI